MATVPTMKQILAWSFLGWVLVVPCAIANGALRQEVLIPWWGMRVAQPISGVLLLAIITLIVAWMVRRIGPQTWRVFFLVGLGWMVATFAFETTMGVVTGQTLDQMCAAYRFEDNNFWPLVLLWIAVAPLLMARWRGLVVRAST